MTTLRNAKKIFTKTLNPTKQKVLNFVRMESLGMWASFRQFPHTIEVPNGLINNKLPWDLDDD
jgi:hypothetical protein